MANKSSFAALVAAFAGACSDVWASDGKTTNDALTPGTTLGSLVSGRHPADANGYVKHTFLDGSQAHIHSTTGHVADLDTYGASEAGFNGEADVDEDDPEAVLSALADELDEAETDREEIGAL